jgi:HK97 family phage major capsid protein
MSIQALREQRDAKAAELKALANKTDYKPETDNPVFDALADEVSSLDDRIARMEKANALAFENNAIDDAAEKLNRTLRNQRGPGDKIRAAAIEAFTKWCRVGEAGLTAEERSLIRNDLSVGTAGAGGFTVQTDVATFIIEALKDFGGMRRTATILRTEGGNPLQIPASDGTAELGAIVAENAAAGDLDPSFTQIPLPVFMYSSLVVPVSLQLLMDSQIDVESFVTRRLVSRLGRIQNQHFTVGTGTGQPNGIVTAAAIGRTGATGTATSTTYDDLVDTLHSVDIEYRMRPDAAWMMNDLTMRQIRKIKDTAGLPIFARSTDGAGAPTGAPDTILGYRVEINNDVPAMAANAKSILFGALADYHIRDVLDVLLQRYDDSAYAKKAQVGFNAWMRSGGNLIDNGGSVKAFRNSAT